MQPNRVARILGIEKPVVQGPLSWLTDARLVAATPVGLACWARTPD